MALSLSPPFVWALTHLVNKMKYLNQAVLWLFSAFFSASVYAAPAALHLYVFLEGKPLENVIVKHDRKSLGVTDKNGAAHLDVPAGDYQLDLVYEGQSLKTVPMALHSGGSTQLILSIPEKGALPDLDIESSQGNLHRAGGDESLAAQANATISGFVFSLEGSKPIPNARVFISGVRQDVRTDDDGRFSLAVPAGEYSLSVVHSEYSTQTLSGLNVEKGGELKTELELTPSGLQLEEFVVSAPALEGGVLALADEQKETANVVEVMSADQMSNAGDSTAAGALKRVTGLTVVDGKYIYVRGMGERYSSVNLSGASLPSPNPYRRAVELDLFPTNVLGSVIVQKTYSPDMPGEFGGGAVELRTVTLAEERFTKVSVSLGGNTLTTLQDGRTYEGGAYDFIGFDDGSRQMPSTLSSLTDGGRTSMNDLTPQEQELAGESLANNYATQPVTLPPDVGFKYSTSDRWEGYDSEDWGWGYLFSLKYNNKWSQRNEQAWDYSLAGDGRGTLISEDEYQRDKTENEVELGAVLHLGYEVGDAHRFGSTTMLSRRTVNSVQYEQAYLAENELYVRDTRLDWEERQLFTQQLNGKHNFEGLHDLLFEWQATYAMADLYAPDRRKYRYELQRGNEDDPADDYWAFSRFGESNQRFFDEMTEENVSVGLDFSLPLYDLLSNNTVLKFGLFVEQKEHEASSTSFRFINNVFGTNSVVTPQELISDSPEQVLTPDNIDPAGYKLVTTTQPSDAFRAKQTVIAQYLMGHFDYDHFNLMAGARLENYSPESETFDRANPTSSVPSTAPDTSSVLPAASLTWLLSDKQQLRWAASKTVNRPELKEISDARWLNRETNDYYRGNVDLTEATIFHLDMRWEYYMTRFESVSTALFYKKFDSPIEEITRLGGGNEITFMNVESATNYGVEIQGRSWLSRFFGRSFSRYYLESNVSLVDSSVSLGSAGQQMTSKERPLQGQSPWVVNMTLGYENLVAMSKASLLFNMAGERIKKVETQGIPDVYEQPVPLVDFVYSKTFYEGDRGDKLKLKVRLKNLLDPEFKTTKGDEVEKVYRKGRSIKATLEYKFAS